MKTLTGKHHARRTAAHAEPSPITALRDMLATAFAADVAAVTPTVSDLLRDTIHAAVGPRQEIIDSAATALAANSGVLAMGVAQEFRSLFDQKLRVAIDSIPKGRTGASGLSPMDEALLDTDLAADQCASRLREQASPEIFQLTARVAALLDKPSLKDAENPIVPRVFVNALLGALRKMSFGDDQRLAVFKAFGPPLLHIAPDLYGHANGLLAERGVLRDFNALYGQPTNPSSSSSARAMERVVDDQAALASILERLLTGGRARAGLLSNAML